MGRPKDEREERVPRRTTAVGTLLNQTNNTTMNKKDNYEDYSDKEYRYPRKV